MTTLTGNENESADCLFDNNENESADQDDEDIDEDDEEDDEVSLFEDDISENTDDTNTTNSEESQHNQEKADSKILQACKELDAETIMTFNHDSVSKELAMSAICAAVRACTKTVEIATTIRIVKYIQSLHSGLTLDIPLMALITDENDTVPENLLNVLVKHITDPTSIIKCLVVTESSLWKKLLQLFIKYGYLISPKDLLRIIKLVSSSHSRRLDKIISILIKYSLLNTVYENEEERRALSKLTNVIISTPYMKSLDAILDSKLDLTLTLCRFGIFQDSLDRDCCGVVSRLLENKQILAFYLDIIENLLARNSPIIHSQKMKDILVNAIKNE